LYAHVVLNHSAGQWMLWQELSVEANC
jgi:hypothetical protein